MSPVKARGLEPDTMPVVVLGVAGPVVGVAGPVVEVVGSVVGVEVGGGVATRGGTAVPVAELSTSDAPPEASKPEPATRH